jgi:hypothetical protein
MTARGIEQIISETAVGWLEVRTSDGQKIEIHPEIMEWEAMEKERLLIVRNNGRETFINIDQITTIKRIEP